MISKIGISEIARTIQALGRKRSSETANSDSDLDSDTDLQDTTELHREGNLDPDSVRLIESILENDSSDIHPEAHLEKLQRTEVR